LAQINEQKARLFLKVRKSGSSDPRILNAMEQISREKFISNTFIKRSFEDIPLPIACNQTVSQPSLVALMLDQLQIPKRCKVLEIGTGSGFQSAILSKLASRVYSLERHNALVISAKERLSRLGVSNVTIVLGDGFLGYKNQAPFDRIIVSAAVEEIPKILIEQLKIDGVMVLPVGLPNEEQILLKVTKKPKSLDIKEVLSVRFVQMLEGISKD